VSWIDWFKALMPAFVELIKTLAGAEYDEEAEKQAMLSFTRTVSDARAARDLRGS
jgi:hypothetical protein